MPDSQTAMPISALQHPVSHQVLCRLRVTDLQALHQCCRDFRATVKRAEDRVWEAAAARSNCPLPLSPRGPCMYSWLDR